MKNIVGINNSDKLVIVDSNATKEETNQWLIKNRGYKIKVLVDALRLVSEDKDISIETLLIPEECEVYGFVEGKHNLGSVLHFLADMLEE
ncbi:MAG: hypothetical protein SGJ10_10155 [Bacteroidota bacterium]|nr:hypothetical protein [Bacteroidota bacterium]